MTHVNLVAFRRDLHRKPELSGAEKKTAEAIFTFVSECKPTSVIELGETAKAYVFDSGQPGSTVLLRADMDALPITEEPKWDHASQVKDVAHKCGHDGHTTMLCGVAEQLYAQPLAKGKAILLFQAAEETGKGAAEAIAHPNFRELKPDWVFALHNVPGAETSHIICKPGAFTAAVRSLIFCLKGKTAHAAEPENGINPALAIAEILQQTDRLNLNLPQDPHFQLVTPVYVTLGEKAYGTSAGYAEVHLTLRSRTNQVMQGLVAQVEALAEEVAQRYQLGISTEHTEVFYATQNNENAVNAIAQAAAQIKATYTIADRPFKWGEDFGLFTEHFPGAMYGLGAGKHTAPLHHPDYDFPDEIMETGIALFTRLLRNLC